MPDKFDLPSNLGAHFPTHGWIESVGGIKLLLAPITQLLRTPIEIEQFRREAGLPNAKLNYHWIRLSTATNTLHRLAICLRELHREVREVGPLCDSTEKLELTRHHEGHEKIELLLVAAFALLRRLADDLVLALRPALFACHESAPRKLATLVNRQNAHGLDDLIPGAETSDSKKVLPRRGQPVIRFPFGAIGRDSDVSGGEVAGGCECG